MKTKDPEIDKQINKIMDQVDEIDKQIKELQQIRKYHMNRYDMLISMYKIV